MGWISGYYSRKSLIRQLTTDSEYGGTTRRCLKKVTKGNILWSVWEIAAPGVASHRYIGYDIMQRFKGEGWGVKSLDESCGPSHYTCPLTFFTDVPEPPNDYAARWRATIKEQAAGRRGFKPEGWIKLKSNCKPLFVRCRSVRPFRCYGYRITRRLLERPVPELDELLAKMDTAFGAFGRNSWHDMDPDVETRTKMLAFAEANPFPVDRKFFECECVTPALTEAWFPLEREAA